MKKSMIRIYGLSIVFLATIVYGQGNEVDVTLTNDFVTKYIWRGYDRFDDHASWQPSLDLDLGAGWSTNFWYAQPIGSGSENVTELDYTLAYNNTVMEDEWYETAYIANYVYYDFPKDNGGAHLSGSDLVGDAQELSIKMAFPKVFDGIVEGLTPSYYISKFWLSQGGNSGAFHILGLDYAITCPVTSLPILLEADVTYNDGVLGSDHDWSHFTYKASTSIDVTGMNVRPYIAFQQSMEDSVNKEDEFWVGVSTSVNF